MKESIGECLEVIFEDSCPECKIDSVLKLAYKCLELGKQSTRQDVMEYLEKQKYSWILMDVYRFNIIKII